MGNPIFGHYDVHVITAGGNRLPGGQRGYDARNTAACSGRRQSNDSPSTFGIVGAADKVHLSADPAELNAGSVSAATCPNKSTDKAEFMATMLSFLQIL
jgi:hypothetical protein